MGIEPLVEEFRNLRTNSCALGREKREEIEIIMTMSH